MSSSGNAARRDDGGGGGERDDGGDDDDDGRDDDDDDDDLEGGELSASALHLLFFSAERRALTKLGILDAARTSTKQYLDNEGCPIPKSYFRVNRFGPIY